MPHYPTNGRISAMDFHQFCNMNTLTSFYVYRQYQLDFANYICRPEKIATEGLLKHFSKLVIDDFFEVTRVYYFDNFS